MRGEEQESSFCKGKLLLGGELLLSRDSLGSYVDDALIPGENPPKNFTFLGACEGGNERHVPGGAGLKSRASNRENDAV